MLEINKIKGVIPPIVTPVDAYENVDPDGLRRVIDYVLEGGVHGIFVLGSNGEFYGFDEDNYQNAIEITVQHTGGRVPVYAGIGSITTKACLRQARMAEEAGADAITVLTPMFINPSTDELYDHFKTIAEGTPLPVLLYNNPGKTTNDIPVGLLTELARIDNIMGIKNTSINFAQTIQYLNETKNINRFNVLSGTDYYIYATLTHGGTGCVAGTANVAPALVTEIYDKFMAGDHAGALEAQNRLIPLRNAYALGSFPVVMKDCMNLLGLNVGSPVKPIGHCREEQMDALRGILQRLELINN